MRILNSQVVLSVVGVMLLVALLLMAGCAMDKFKMSFERGVLSPKSSSLSDADHVVSPSAGSAASAATNASGELE